MGTNMEWFDLEYNVEPWNLRYGRRQRRQKKKELFSAGCIRHTHEVRTPHASCAPALCPHNSALRYPCRSSVAIMAKTYRCMCSTCYDTAKYITKRTVEAHILRDRERLRSASATNTDLIDFLDLRIQETLGVLSGTRGGSRIPDTASDLGRSHRSHSAGSELGLDSEGTQI